MSDHNGMKGYSGIYVLKAAIEKVGKLDRKAVAAALHTLNVKATDQPGVLMDVAFDSKGDLDRESFMVEVRNGKQVVVAGHAEMIGYDLKSGDEKWHVSDIPSGNVASPVVALMKLRIKVSTSWSCQRGARFLWCAMPAPMPPSGPADALRPRDGRFLPILSACGPRVRLRKVPSSGSITRADDVSYGL